MVMGGGGLRLPSSVHTAGVDRAHLQAHILCSILFNHSNLFYLTWTLHSLQAIASDFCPAILYAFSRFFAAYVTGSRVQLEEEIRSLFSTNQVLRGNFGRLANPVRIEEEW
jgi:hypothetical protein